MNEQLEQTTPITTVTFDVHDLGVAQFLIYKGHRVACVRDRQRCTLILRFANSPEVRGDVAEYVSGATVRAFDFAESGRVMRRILGAVKSNERSARKNERGALRAMGRIADGPATDATEAGDGQ